jgi:hypothetical protein
MSDIANLQEAVETGRAAYARTSEQYARSRKHALSLIHIVEDQLHVKRIELSQNDDQRQRLTHEYGQLRQMLHALIIAVDVGASGAPGNGPTAIEARSNGGTPLAPMDVASEPKEPSTEADQAGAAKAGAGPEEVRDRLKRITAETVQVGRIGAPAPAEYSIRSRDPSGLVARRDQREAIAEAAES